MAVFHFACGGGRDYILHMHRETKGLEYVDTVVKVRYAETDQMGVVYYANYLVWFEVGRVAWCDARGFRYSDLEGQHDRMMMVAEATCRYRAPARFEEEILIRTAVAAATDKVVRFHYELRRKGTGEFLASGETAHVVVDGTLRPARLPAEYRKFFLLPDRK
jgi:acyl-CoA thioester hydrolase